MPGNMPNRLEVLPNLMLSSLPIDASPQLRDPYDAVALFAHAAMLSVEFRLVGLGEDHQIPAESTDSKTNPLPSEWNETKSSSYAFRYKHAQSSLDFMVKVSRLGRKAVINALAIDDDKVHSFDITVNEFLSQSSFPYTLPGQLDSTLEQGHSGARRKSITDLFISEGRLGDFWALFKINIVQKIAPGLAKGGDTHQSADDADAQRQADDETRTYPSDRAPQRPPRGGVPDPDLFPPSANPRPIHDGDPLAPEQARPRPHGDMPGWDDEYDVLRVPGRGGSGGLRAPGLGQRDLYPQGMGPNDPFRASGPGLGGLGGGGMYPTREDFFGGGEQGFGDPSAPPGARFDPPFPGMGPPRGSGGGFGGPGSFGGPGGGFGGPSGFGGGII